MQITEFRPAIAPAYPHTSAGISTSQLLRGAVRAGSDVFKHGDMPQRKF